MVNCSIRSLLNPELTASWEKGLTYVAEGTITPEEYMVKLENFVRKHTGQVAAGGNISMLRSCFDAAAVYYNNTADPSKAAKSTVSRASGKASRGGKKDVK